MPVDSLGEFASLRAAAASISRDCPATAEAGLAPPGIALAAEYEAAALWLPGSGTPRLYAATDYSIPVTARRIGYRFGVFSARGLAVRLPRNTFVGPLSVVALWPCNPPVLFYFGKTGIRMMALASSPREPKSRTVLGGEALNNATIDPQGQLLQVEAHSVRYPDGTLVTPRGIPTFGTWGISYIAPSPIDPHVFAAEVDNGDSSGGRGTGRLYLAGFSATFLHFLDNARDGAVVEWNRDGSKLLYGVPKYTPPERGMSLYVCDLRGRHRRLLASFTDGIRSALWSPNGKEIAVTEGAQASEVAVVNVASGAVRLLTPLHWAEPKPPRPYYPPFAHALAWSPDSKNVAILYATADYAQTVVETIPAAGGTPQIVIRLPIYKGPPIK